MAETNKHKDETTKGGGGYLSGIGGAIQGISNALNPFGAKKTEVQPAAVVEPLKNRPVTELTPTETPAPAHALQTCPVRSPSHRPR